MIEVLKDLPQGVWTAFGVVLGAFLTGLFTFVNALWQRRMEREKLYKVWLLDEGIRPLVSHIARFRRDVAARSTARIREFCDKDASPLELEIVQERYGTDWSVRYHSILSKVSEALREGELDRIRSYDTELAMLQNELVAAYEWQAVNLLASDRRRKQLLAKIRP